MKYSKQTKGTAYHQNKRQLLLTVATISELALIAVQLAVNTGTSEHPGGVCAYTASTGSLDQNRIWLAG